MSADKVRVKSLTEEELFCLEGCRDYEQYYHMRHLFELGVCPFCNINTDVNKVLYETDTWMLWENPFPRKTLEVQLVIVSKSHIRHLEEVTQKGWSDFFHMIQWIEGDDGHFITGTGGNLHIRFGDMRYNAGTIQHLHWNYWVPSCLGEVRIPVLKNPQDRKENRERALAFSARYEAHEVP